MLHSLLFSGDPAMASHGVAAVDGAPGCDTPEYWTAKLSDPDAPLMDQAAIAEFNRRSLASGSALVDATGLPDALSGAELRDMLRKPGDRIDFQPFRPDGTPYSKTEVAGWLDNRACDAVQESNPVRFALVIRRAQMRRFPVTGPVRDEKLHPVIDKFDETAAFPGEAAAILHTSRDRRWALVRRCNYLAWMPLDALAVGDRQTVRDYRNAPDFLVVTGAGIRIAPPDGQPGDDKLQLDMGLRFPLRRDGGERYYRIDFPVRRKDGTLAFAPVDIPRNAEVREGYLPYTRGNIIRQAFRFLGEPYGWGDAGNARDCSGLILSVYSSMGLTMARNTPEQEYAMSGQNTDFRDRTTEEKQRIFARLEPGDLIYTPTHVMIVLGRAGGETYIIHDALGGWFRPQNAAFDAPLLPVWFNAVTVTPFERFFDNPQGRPYLDLLRTAKRLVLPDASGW